MRKINVFFLIGTLGILATAILNILLETMISQVIGFSSISGLYPVFMLFLIFGTYKMVGNKNRLSEFS